MSRKVLPVQTYAIAVATAAGAEKILLAGVDGYPSSDPRQLEMVEMMNSYQQLSESLELSAVTPTTYPIDQRSIYEPGL